MARSLAQITQANQKAKTPGTTTRNVASSKLGTSSSSGIRGGGVKGSSDALKR